MDGNESKTDDLSQLENLDVDTILSVTEARYSRDQIYTNVGNILIAVNPCKPLSIYDEKHHELYKGLTSKELPPPHIFHMGARVYRAMQETKTNQVVLVCGESGAGKTETTKYLVKHLMEMCPAEAGDLHKRIIEINPLLEAFGNAKTIMNDNSSRFAKYLELSFRSDGQVSGATVRDYMLEKSRVVGQSQNEGNFHIFYSLFAGATSTKLKELGLQKPETYRVMQSNIELLRATEHYKEMYTQQVAVLQEIGLKEEEIDIVHYLLASVLHLTQVDFKEMDRSTEELDVQDQEPLRLAADCLSLDFETLGHALIATTKQVRGESIKQFKSLHEARDGRDALAKAVYERTFGFIVRKINENLHPSRSRTLTTAAIGLLDIAGFEKLQKNSFEQMCINVTNERLQHHMNETVIVQEKRLYQEEGIPLEDVNFQNNKDVLNLYTLSRRGIFAALDEVSRLQQGTDKLFVERVLQISRDDPVYKPYLTFPKGDRAEFCVKHFAGQVWYNCEGFLEKNRDTLTVDLDTCLKESKDPFIQDLFTVKKGPTGTISQTVFNLRKSKRTPGKGAAPRTREGEMLAAELGKTLTQRFGKIGRATEILHLPKDHKSVISYFQKSMHELLNKMQLAEPHFIRCVKPNMSLRPGNFDMVMVRDQLVYNGVAEIARIRKMAFSVRKKKDDFKKRYACILPATKQQDLATILRRLLPPSLAQGVRVGKHKVFMKEEVNMWLEKCLLRRENAASKTIVRGLKVMAERKRKERERKERERKEKERREREAREAREEERRRKKKQEQEETELKPFSGTDLGNTLGRTDTSNSSQESGSNESEGSRSSSSSDRFNINKLRGTRGPKGSFRESTGSRDTTLDSDEEEDEDDKEEEEENQPRRPGDVNMQFYNRPSTSSPPRTKEPEKKTPPFWDIFQIIARESPEQDVHTHLSLRVIKVMTYGLLFLIMLAAMVTQKISLMSLVVHISNDSSQRTEVNKADASAHYFLVIIAMCIPYVLVLLVSFWRSLFGNVTFPSIGSIFVVCFIEMMHSIGLCLLTFKVLPKLYHAQGIMIMSATCLIPSILKPLCSKDTTTRGGCGNACCKIFVFVLDLLAIFIQISVIPVAVLPKTTKYFPDEKSDSLTILETVFALVMCSFTWWENFIDDRLCGNVSHQNKLQRTMMGLKFDLQESRPFISMFVGVVKLITTVLTTGLLTIGIAHIDILDFSGIFGQLKGGLGDKKNLSISLLTISSFVAYYTAYTACKLKMQSVSFSLPLFLSTPIAVLVVSVDCQGVLKQLHDFYNITDCGDDDITDPWYILPIGAAWLLSVYWIGRYIWTSSQERLAKVERLFMNPLYCGILLEQHLIMNRRRHNRRITKTTDGKYKLSKDDVKMGKTEDDEERGRTIPPMIYACATMWHENRQEMVQILKSLYRMDKDQFIRRQAYDMSKNMTDTEYYEFEVHILFDDAFELDDDEEHVPNSFVRMFCSLQNEAASSVHGKPMDITPPFRIPSPYGGQLVFVMPGGNFMFVHLKDKSKIRHRKRWSQVMYMYYLLGYRIVKECQERVLYAMENNAFNELASWSKHENTGLVERSKIFQLLDDEVIYRAENTFLLALDGDVDFTPGAVRLLLDRMYKNLKVGAACGRIHPIGKGPMVWYQKFEYATAHWLQKATEHVLGCVLCSPGCFSLFRGSALMDDNIMRKYTIMPTEASHHLMYDQGEDRWLCTLLLQQGYRVDYAAASDAYTYAPEAFDEFFNQRRRWMPSTIANIMDLLQDGKNTVSVNNNISWLYIFYQAALMVSTIIGPSTVLMMIAGALLTVFNLNLLVSYLISLAPALFFFVICFVVKSKTQILIAEVLSAVYTFIMMVVLVGAIITAVQESPAHPSVIFLAGLVLIFFVAALFHPREWTCIIYGVLYFLWVPSGFLLLVLYSLCNLNVVSWGTREVPKKKTKKELEEEEKKKQEEAERKKQGWFARTFGSAKLTSDLKDFLKELPGQKKEEDKIASLLQQLNKNILLLAKKESGMDAHDLTEVKVEAKTERPKKTVHFRETIEEKELLDDEEEYIYQKEKKIRDPLKNPAWTECEELGDGENIEMNPEECTFWKGFIDRYLFPLDAAKFKEKNKESAIKLKELRNNICAGMALINLLWLAINFMFQLRKPTVVTFPVPSGKEEEDVENQNLIKVDILGLAFVIFFLVILIIQFVGMIVHRWGTFLHLIAITEIPNPFRRKATDFLSERDKSKQTAREAVEVCSKLMAEPMPDYDDDEDDDIAQQSRAAIRQELQNLAAVGTRDNLRESGGALGRSIRASVRQKSYSGSMRQEDTKHHTMADDGFRQTVTNYLRQSRNYQNNPDSVENPNLRQRNRQAHNIEAATIDIGQTLPRDVTTAQRKFGTGVPYRRDFMERVVGRRTDLADKYKFTSHADSMAGGANRLGHSFNRERHLHQEEGGTDEEEDNIYDEIPAAKMGTLGRQFARQLHRLEKSGRNNQNGTVRSTRNRNSGYNQYLS